MLFLHKNPKLSVHYFWNRKAEGRTVMKIKIFLRFLLEILTIKEYNIIGTNLAFHLFVGFQYFLNSQI